MRVSVFGLGYVGVVSLACLARDGNEVIGVDVNPNKLEMIGAGDSPIAEEGIQELVAEVVGSGRVAVTNDPGQAIAATDLSFVCVGTPSASNGSQDLSSIQRVCSQIGAAISDKSSYHNVVIRSTVMPGTTDAIIAPILARRARRSVGPEPGLCFQPEFLREGSSIKDYDDPPFTIVGSASKRAVEMVRELFSGLSSVRRYMETNPHERALREIFQLARIDYGKIDYAILGDRLQIWEINTNPVVLTVEERNIFLSSDPDYAERKAILSQRLESLAAGFTEIDAQNAPDGRESGATVSTSAAFLGL